MADIDFGSADSRMNYLKDNLGHLMKGIDKNYGQVLMDELMRRLETTVSEFNEEVKAMLDQLQGKESKSRDNIMNASVPSFDPVQPTTSVPLVEKVDEGVSDLSEFEKKLQSIDS